MAKEFYIPVNGFSKKTSKFYAPVNGFSKEIVKAYCSVNGFSKLFYEKGGGGGSVSIWDFYSTIVETIIEGNCNDIPNPIWVEVDKTDAGIAFYFIMVDYEEPYYDPWHWVVTLSTDQLAVSYIYDNWDGTKRNCQVGSISYNGETWYFGYATPLSFVTKPIYPSDYKPDCLYDYKFQAGQGILDYIMPMIYSDDFAEDYQVGQTYNLSLGDIEKTIRKTIGVFLFKFVSMKGTVAYDTLLANVDTVVDNILNRCESGGYDKILIGIQISSSSFTVQARMTNLSIDSSTTYPQITSRTSRNGYDFVVTNSFVKPQYQIDHLFNNSGMTKNEQALTPSYYSYAIGMRVESNSIGSSNIGLNL